MCNLNRERIKGQIQSLLTDGWGLVNRFGRIWVSFTRTARYILMDKAHKSKFSIHPSAIMMYMDLKGDYWWPKMKRDIAMRVRNCLNCLKVKVEDQMP